MSIDPTGTAPGLALSAQKAATPVNLKCPKCPSMEAEEIRIEGSQATGQRVYRCIRCGHTKSLSVGAPFVF